MVNGVYAALLDGGWRMDEIDRMDMIGYFRIRAWQAAKKKKDERPKRRYIDEVWEVK